MTKVLIPLEKSFEHKKPRSAAWASQKDQCRKHKQMTAPQRAAPFWERTRTGSLSAGPNFEPRNTSAFSHRYFFSFKTLHSGDKSEPSLRKTPPVPQVACEGHLSPPTKPRTHTSSPNVFTPTAVTSEAHPQTSLQADKRCCLETQGTHSLGFK